MVKVGQKGGSRMNKRVDFTKLDQAIIYLVSELPGLTRTKLVKLLYLADVTHCTHHRVPLTGVTYYNYYYGPYSEEIKESVDRLNPYEIEESYRTAYDGREYYTYSLGTNPRITDLDLSNQEKETLNKIVAKFGLTNLNELLKHVYTTPQYRSSKKGEPINLSSDD
jgi:uncharacterized protein YwgA